MVTERSYQDSLGIANQLVEPLLYNAPHGADCGVEVSQKLQENGFMKCGEDQRLRYVGEKIEVIYDFLADKPFSMILDGKNSDAVSEARTVLSKLIEIVEDI
ncbi:MAG: hypothetical protein AABX50_01995 [Nanoarchaeota archaeon]